MHGEYKWCIDSNEYSFYMINVIVVYRSGMRAYLKWLKIGKQDILNVIHGALTSIITVSL